MATSRRPAYRFTGKGICRWCGTAVPKGRRNWCSAACVEEFTTRAWPDKLRRKVLERGICAGCGIQCRGGANERMDRLEPPVEVPPDAPAWEADHIVPVVEGGGGCGLENIRTLCVPCHRRETAALAARRAAARREARQPSLPGMELLRPGSRAAL